jgi:MalT-like TPR region
MACQNVGGGRPLSHLQHLARFPPSTVGMAKSVRAKVQCVERTQPPNLQLHGKGSSEVEDGQRLLGRIGRPEEGLQLLEQGFASVVKSGKRASSPSLHHVKGQLLLIQNPSDVAEAERCFRAAIEIARRQSARAIELRATRSLARVLAKQGRRDAARAILAKIYNWFTEGFDTRDLKDAKALLDELSR